MDEEFQILLGAKFDEKEIQSQLNKLTNFSINVDTIKVNRQAINDLEKNNRISLKLEVDNTANAQKQIQQAAQNAQKSFGNVNVKDFLDNQTKKLMENFGVTGKKAFREIRQAVGDCFADIQKAGKITQKVFDDTLGIKTSQNLFDGVTKSLRENIKVANEAQGALADFYNYVKGTNTSGAKIHIPNSVKQEFGEEWKNVRSMMGKAFTTQDGNFQDLENYFAELNSVIGTNYIDLSQGVEVAARQFVAKLQEARHGLKFFSGDDLPKDYKQVASILAQTSAEEMLAFSQNLSSVENIETRSADIIVESEKRKQQAMEETANVAKKTSQTVVDGKGYSDSVAVSKNKNKEVSNLAYKQYNSDGTYNQGAANQAHARIKELLEDEEALIATTQRLDSTGNLQSFSTNIKHANGLVETLNFSLKEVEETNEKIFMFNGATLNDSGAIKLFEQRQKALEQYQNKYREFLSKNSGAELNTTDIDKAFESFKQGSISIDELKSSWSSFISETQEGINRLKSQKVSLDPVQQTSNSMRDMPTRIESITRRMEELADKSSLAGVSTEEFTQRYERLNADIQANNGKIPLTEEWSRGFQSLNSDIASFEVKLKELESQQQKLANFKTNQLPQIQNNVSYGVYSDQVAQQYEKYERLGYKLPQVEEALRAMETAEKNLSAVMADTTATTEQQKAAFDKFQEASKTAAQKTSKAGAMYMSGDQIQTLTAQLEAFRQKNTAMTSEAKAKIAEWISALQGVAPVYASTGRKIRAELKTLENQQRGLGKLGLSPFDTIKQGMQKFSYWTSATYIVMQTVRAVKEMVGNVKELDDALTNISYTMDVSNNQLERIGKNALQMSTDLNSSVSNVLGAVKLYANAKENADSIIEKAKPAIMLSNVTGMTGEQSAKMLQAVMNQFDLTQDDLWSIVDTIQAVSQNMAYDFSSGINEISSGIERSGSVAKNAGLDLQEYASMLGLVIEQTGQSGDTIGNAYKTIFQRITKASKIEGTSDEDISKAEESLRAVGVEVRDSADEFRDLTDIMADLGKVWDSLNSVQKSNISYNIAGIRQANILSSLLGNWQGYTDLVDKANNSSGTTLKTQEKYAESLSGKLQGLSATWEKIGDEAINSDFLKMLVDVGGALSTIVEKLGLVKSVLIGVSAYAGIKNFGIFKTMENFNPNPIKDSKINPSSKGIGVFGHSLSEFRHYKSYGIGAKDVLFGNSDANALKAFNIELEKFKTGTSEATSITQVYKMTMGGASEEARKHAVAIAGGKKSLNDFSASQVGATQSTVLLTAKTIALNMALSMGLSFAIQGLFALFDNLAHAEEHCKERADELVSSFDSAISKANDQAKTIDSIAGRYEELSKGVDGLGQNVSLTTKEYEEYNSIVNQVADMFPTLISGYTSEGNAILSLKGNVESLRDAYKEAQQEAYNMLVTSGKDGDSNDIVQSYKYLSENDWWNKQTVKGDDFKTIAKRDVAKLVVDSNSVKEFEQQLKELFKEHNWEGRDATRYLRDELGLTSAYSADGSVYLGKLDESAFKAAKKTAKAYAQTYQAEINAELSKVGKLANAYLMTNEDYANLDDQSKAAASKIVNSLNENIASQFSKKEDVGEWVGGIVEDITNHPEIRDAVTGVFAVDTDGLSPDEAKEIIDKYIETIAKALDEDENELKIRLGFEDTDKLAERYNNAIKSASEKFNTNSDDIKQFFKENSINTQEEIDRWIEVAKSAKTAEEAKKAYLEHPLTKATQDLDKLHEALDKVQSAYQTVTSAIKEYNCAGFLSVDTFQELMKLEPKYLNMLLDESGNLMSNTDAVMNNTAAYIDNIAITKAYNLLQELSGIQGKTAQLDYLTGVMQDNTAATWDSVYALIAQEAAVSDPEVIDALYSRIDAIRGMAEAAKNGLGKGGLSGNAQDASKNVEDTNKKLEDTQRQIADLDKKANLDKIKYQFDSMEQAAEKLDNTLNLLNDTLDLLGENDYVGKIGFATLQLDLAREKAGMLADEFNQLRNTQYDSADAANEIASRMKSVADEIAANQKALIGYGRDITKYYADALKSVNSLSKSQLEEASTLIDRNIKSLTEGGLIGMQFDLSPVSTPMSVLEKQRKENMDLEKEMQAHYDAVAEMQRIALDLQYQETIEDNARQREELIKSLNEIKGTLGNHYAKIQSDQDKAEVISENSTKQSDINQQVETAGHTNAIETIFTQLFDWIKNNPITPPLLKGFDTWIQQIQNYAQQAQNAMSGGANTPIAGTVLGSGREAVVNAVKSKLGYKASGDKSNIFSGWINKTNLFAQDWCADFASWALSQGGFSDIRDSSVSGLIAQTKPTTTPQPGDLAYTLYDDGRGRHVEVVIAVDYDNKKVTTIGGNSGSHTGGEVVEHTRDLNYWKGFRTYATGTGKFGYNGVAGENNKPEYLVDKKTGEMTRVTSPTLVNTDKVEVVGENETARAEKRKFAKGTIPVGSGRGALHDYTAFNEDGYLGSVLGHWDKSSAAWKLFEELLKSGELTVDKNGIYMYKGARLAATTSKFGTAGDLLKVNQEGGNPYYVIVMDEKRQTDAGANEYGHKGGNAVVEFEVKRSAIDSQYKNSGLTPPYDDLNHPISSIENLGNYKDALGTISSDVSSISSDTAKIARLDFATQIKNLIEGKGESATTAKEGFEDELLKHLGEKFAESETSANNLIDAFNAMRQLDTKNRAELNGLLDDLKESAGTDRYGEVQETLRNASQLYADNTIAAQIDYQLTAIKESFDRARQAQEWTAQYYDAKAADENVTAEELTAIAESYQAITKEMQEYSDQYNETLQKYSEYMVSNAARELKLYDDRLSWQERINEKIEKELDNVSSVSEKNSILQKQLQANDDTRSILDDKKARAHEIAENIRNDERFKEVFERFDTYSWFDADGNFSSKFEEDRLKASANPELLALLNEVAPVLQKCTQEFQSADKASENIVDNAKKIKSEMAQLKIETYTENLERLNEIDEVRKGKQDAITAAMQQQHSLAQSLREETSNINAELDAIKHTEQWLDEDTRKIIFNDEDYETELNAINKIQSQANNAYRKYKSDIAGLNETEWYKEQQITDEYNKRMDVLKEQLQVEKDKLAVKKKELEYNNALKERDTRIIVGGQVRMVANPDTMYNLAKERSQAQSDLNNTLLTNKETEQERQSDRISQSINQEIETRNKMVELIGKMSDAEQELFAATLPVIEELEVFKEALSPQNIPWLNSHSRDFRDDFVDMPELYKHGGYNQAHDYAGDYPIIEQLYHSGIIRGEVYEALTQQAENQHNWKRSTDVNTAQYPYTRDYGDVNYGAEYYGINDEAKWADTAAREQAREYQHLVSELNNGKGTQDTINRLKELNESNAADNKYIANVLDTTQYTVSEDGVAIRKEELEAMGEIARGAFLGALKDSPIASKNLSSDGTIAVHRASDKHKDKEIIAHGKFNTYANGTKSAKAGLALTDEEGYEFKLKQLGGKFRALDGGEMIFSNPQSANLYEFSQNPPNYIQEQIAKMNGQMASVVTNTDNRKSEIHNHFDIHDFDVNKPTNVDAFMDELLNRASGRYDVTKNIRNM